MSQMCIKVVPVIELLNCLCTLCILNTKHTFILQMSQSLYLNNRPKAQIVLHNNTLNQINSSLACQICIMQARFVYWETRVQPPPHAYQQHQNIMHAGIDLQAPYIDGKCVWWGTHLQKCDLGGMEVFSTPALVDICRYSEMLEAANRGRAGRRLRVRRNEQTQKRYESEEIQQVSKWALLYSHPASSSSSWMDVFPLPADAARRLKQLKRKNACLWSKKKKNKPSIKRGSSSRCVGKRREKKKREKDRKYRRDRKKKKAVMLGQPGLTRRERDQCEASRDKRAHFRWRFFNVKHLFCGVQVVLKN